jgi:hypothetical protein
MRFHTGCPGTCTMNSHTNIPGRTSSRNPRSAMDPSSCRHKCCHTSSIHLDKRIAHSYSWPRRGTGCCTCRSACCSSFYRHIRCHMRSAAGTCMLRPGIRIDLGTWRSRPSSHCNCYPCRRRSPSHLHRFGWCCRRSPFPHKRWVLDRPCPCPASNTHIRTWRARNGCWRCTDRPRVYQCIARHPRR